MSIRRFILTALLTFPAPLQIRAAVPSLDYLFPLGGARGTTGLIEAGGKFDPWPVRVWTERPGLEFSVGETNGTATVAIAPDAPLGPRWIRFYNAEGASEPRLFLVGALPEVREKEPNNTPAQAQLIQPVPATVNGRLEKNGDVDCYSIAMKAGQWLVADLKAYSLDSPIDALLHLTDSNNVKLAFNHDGANLDPFLAWQAEKDGVYVVKVAAFAFPPQANVQFAGQAAAIYRLTLTNGPYLHDVYPFGIDPSKTNHLELFGWNVNPAGMPRFRDLKPDPDTAKESSFLFQDDAFPNSIRLPVGSLPEILERETNDTVATAQVVPLPCTVNGRIQRRGDEDRFLIPVVKDRKYEFRVDSASLGFPLDALLRVEDSTGKELARNDDQGNVSDPGLVWKATANGSNVVVVGDRFDNGGPDFIYRLHLAEAQPRLEAFLEGHTFILEPGQSLDLKVKIKRLNGFSGGVKLQAVNLPEGMICPAVEAPDKDGEVTLKLSAPETAASGAHRFRVQLTSPDGAALQPPWAAIPVKGKYAEAGGLLLNELDQAWLTIRPKSKAAK